MHACRHLVGINDHLVFGLHSQQDATTCVLSDLLPQARRAIPRNGRHFRAVRRAVARSGYRDLSTLDRACLPG